MRPRFHMMSGMRLDDEVVLNGYLQHHNEDDDDDELLDGGNQRPQPKGFGYRYSQLLAHYPLLVFVAILLLTGGCGVTIYFVYDLPEFADATKGFESRGTELTARLFTLGNVRHDKRLSFIPNITKYLDTLGPYTDDVQNWIQDAPEYVPGAVKDIPMEEPPAPGEGASYESYSSDISSLATSTIEMDGLFNGTPSIQPATAGTPSIQPATAGKKRPPLQQVYCNSQNDWVNENRFVFTPVKGGTLFTLEAMHSMCNLQQRILRDFATTEEDRAYLKQPFDDSAQCQRTWSILNMITNLNNKTSCKDISDEDLQHFQILLQDCVEFYEIGLLTDSCVEPAQCQVVIPDKCLDNDVVKTTFHYLTPKSFVTEVKAKTFNLKSTMMFLDIKWDQKWDFYMEVFEKKVVGDGITKIPAMNFFLKFDLFANYLQSDALYLALGIGLAILIIVLYTRSIFITLMTILNMGMSIVVAYFVYRVIFQLSFTPFVNILAVVLLIGIGADDTFVFIDIWNKAKSDMPNKDRAEVMHETLRHATVTMFVTSFTTGSALYANLISSIVAIRCFAVFSGTAIMANFVFTITWLPVVVVIDDWCEEKCFGWRRSILDHAGFCWRPLSKGFNVFFDTYLPLVIFKLRYLWIVIFILLGAGGAYLVFYWPKLQLPTATDFQVFYAEHPLEKYDIVFKKQYDFERDQVDVLPYIVVFGVTAVDDRSQWDPDNKGNNQVVVLDETFDVSEPSSQDWLLKFCRELRKQPFVDHHKNDSHCFVEIVKDHMEEPCPSASVIPDRCCGRNRTDFPYTKTDFQFCTPIVCSIFRDCSGSTGYPFHIPYGPMFRGENNTIAAFAIVATSTYDDGPDYETMHEFVSIANSWTSEKIANANASGMRDGGWFVSKGWYQLGFYALQDGLAVGAAESMAISLAIGALVLFITTRNILISLYAIASVSGTVFVTIGTLVLLGWQLNIIESVILSIAVGLSVDFTIHYGVAYRIAPVTDRQGRSEFALKTLGSAITVGALSTVSAGAMMMPASVLSYSQLGMFMILVMTVSWVYANFFFLSLCRTIGPSRNIAQLSVPRCAPCCADSNAEALDINFYIQNDSNASARNSNQSPDSNNLLEQVEMNAPSTQFSSLVLEL